nr:Chain B, Protein FAM109A [Homo sapiens]
PFARLHECYGQEI